jgi:RNA polymerase sigma-70 factor (ECF subfamily)
VYVEDRSLSDVAGLLGIPEGTIKSRLYNARQLLQAILRKGGYDAASS